MKIKMTIKPEDDEAVNYPELRKELDFLSKNWDIYFEKYLSGWEIVGSPKEKKKEKIKEKLGLK